ncbi:MAG: laccase domain-containing protein, partial [Chthoniobacterales bacterium]
MSLPAEQFAALSGLPGVQHCFTTRVAQLDVQADKTEALRRLDQVHREVRAAYAIGTGPLLTAEQVHGKEIGVVDAVLLQDECLAECDGVISNQPEICLGIYVADCCAVY